MKMEQRQPSVTYACPMHPEVQQHKPGKCPKCGMELVPKEQAEPSGRPGTMHQQDEVMGGNHLEMIRKMREKWLWTNFTVIGLGFWLITSSFTFGYGSVAMTWSDITSGALMALFAGMALFPRLDFMGRWSVAIVGFWLQFAPLIFWAPTPVAYINDTLVGALAIALSILVPMMPGMAHHMAMMKPGPEIPPGWSYNPSSWHQRAPMIGLAFIAWLLSRYLAAYQLGYIHAVWDPFFGQGTVNVLTSKVSKAWPISDAGLGALAYTFEMLMGCMGGKTRWRSMPWMVTFFFILVVPLGLVSVVLVILQPLAVGHWCTLCLITAFIMLAMIPLAVDEVIAMGQFLKASVRNGKSFWRTFWVGDTIDGGEEDSRTPRYGSPMGKMITPMIWGVTVPWNLVVSVLIGLWIMFAPSLLGSVNRAADSDHLVGALIVTVSVIVMAEVIRTGRFINILLGLWIMMSPWLLFGTAPGAKWNDAITGVAVILLSFPRGPIREHYAGWDHYVV